MFTQSVDFNIRCRGLFGRHFKSHLARNIGVDLKTVYRWSTGESAIPGSVLSVLTLLERLPKTKWPAEWRNKRAR